MSELIERLEAKYCTEGDYTGEDAPLALALARMELKLRAYVAGEKQREIFNCLLLPPKIHDALGRLAAWTHEYGVALCPPQGIADSFGEGMRVAKHQVSLMLVDALARPAHLDSNAGGER